MNSVYDKRSRLTYIELIFISLIMVFFISPELNRLVSITRLLFVELLYSIIVCFLDPRSRQIVITTFLCSLVIAVLYSTTTEIVYIEQTASNRILKSLLTVTCQYYSLTFPIILFYRVAVFSTKFQRLILIFITFMSLFIVVHSTLTMLAINERISKQGMGVSDDLTQKAIGGYSFVCAMPLFVSSLFYLFLKHRNVIMKILSVFLILFILSFIIKTQYSIALIAGILGILSSIFIFVRKQYRFFCIIGLTVLFFSLPSILEFFISRVEGDVHLRMIEIRNFIQTGDLGDDDMASRFSLYGKAIVSFIESPLWGNYKLDFNAHSTIFEVLASLGVLGIVPLFISLKRSFRLMNSFVDPKLVIMLEVPFVFMGLTNPIHASLPLNMSLWFMCPLIFIQFINVKDN